MGSLDGKRIIVTGGAGGIGSAAVRLFHEQGAKIACTYNNEGPDLPHGIVRGIAQVLAHPQVAARKLIREAESPVGTVPVIANALKMSDSEARYDRIPGLGEDSEAILKSLGYDAGAIAELRREKVI